MVVVNLSRSFSSAPVATLKSTLPELFSARGCKTSQIVTLPWLRQADVYTLLQHSAAMQLLFFACQGNLLLLPKKGNHASVDRIMSAGM